ncbi:extracellular solute-binding protein [Hwanghaeella grinnelliae]|uniref:extracellular solute-binding protein n=1 Tax=Hwanghaeella grinnelliae TaxID=2500179 RepID=UPI001961CBC6|nr:extracellular solute-binding protein [Hwanghaeella grinnelliae]
MDKQFLKESVQQGAVAFKAGKMDRRAFLTLCAMAGVAVSAVARGDAHAAANQIILWNWGGSSEVCHGQYIAEPFTESTGIGVGFDTSGPLQGKIKAMVDSGSVTADVCDADAFDAIALGDSGHLEPIDYSVVDKAKVLDGFAWEYGVSIIFYGYAFMYDTEAYGDNPPNSWADFFNTAEFPGKRSLYKWANGSLEGALLADGVSKDALYPLDLDRAIAKVKTIKEDSLYWGSGSEAHSMIVNGEVSMGMVWQNRGKAIEDDTDGRYKLVMNEALAMPGAYIVPRGNPAGRDAVMKFIQTAQDPKAQLGLLDCLGMTPTNPTAFGMIPEGQKAYAITSAMNIDKVVYNDPVWWGANSEKAVNAFLEAIS